MKGSINEIQPIIKNRLLTVEDLAGIFGMTVQTIYNKCAKSSKHPFPKTLKPIRVGRKLRFRQSDVENYINSL